MREKSRGDYTFGKKFHQSPHLDGGMGDIVATGRNQGKYRHQLWWGGRIFWAKEEGCATNRKETDLRTSEGGKMRCQSQQKGRGGRKQKTKDKGKVHFH